jgi:hypothetical protein
MHEEVNAFRGSNQTDALPSTYITFARGKKFNEKSLLTREIFATSEIRSLPAVARDDPAGPVEWALPSWHFSHSLLCVA